MKKILGTLLAFGLAAITVSGCKSDLPLDGLNKSLYGEIESREYNKIESFESNEIEGLFGGICEETLRMKDGTYVEFSHHGKFGKSPGLEFLQILPNDENVKDGELEYLEIHAELSDEGEVEVRGIDAIISLYKLSNEEWIDAIINGGSTGKRFLWCNKDGKRSSNDICSKSDIKKAARIIEEFKSNRGYRPEYPCGNPK